MTENEPPWYDQVTPVAAIRSGCHGLAFKVMTGEEPVTESGWQRSTCLEQYDALNPIGKLSVRLMPTGFGLFLAGFALQMPLREPKGAVLLPVAYLVVCWVALVTYDPLMGLVELARGGSNA